MNRPSLSDRLQCDAMHNLVCSIGVSERQYMLDGGRAL
jgi:hypothetical protein